MEEQYQIPEMTKEQQQELWDNFLNLVGLFGGPIGKRNASKFQLEALQQAEQFKKQFKQATDYDPQDVDYDFSDLNMNY